MADSRSGNPRWLALQAVVSVLERGRSIEDALAELEPFTGITDKRDIAFVRALVFGLCRYYLALRPVIANYLKKPLKKKDRDIELILSMGLYQIALLKTGSHAVVNESVQLARLQRKTWAAGLVNAVLRSIIRDRLVLPDDFDERSYPAWIVDKIRLDWPDQYRTIISAGNRRAPMSLRLDTRQMSVDDCLALFQQHAIGARVHEQVQTALVLDSPCEVDLLPGFAQGVLSVQDPAAQLAAGLLNCEPGMRVLDACAAPGGKTLQVLQSSDDIDLLAVDENPDRLKLIEQNLNRAGLTAELLCADAASPADWFGGRPFDRILADVPCSASGVIRRHPDIKLLRTPRDIDNVVGLQRKLLHGLWSVLKPGGLLVYSTCSIFKDENERQIANFLQKHENAELTGPNSVQWGEPRPWGRQILSGSQNMDGFYYACLQKNEL